ncbi:MAG TPA: hypothetical protein VF520_13435 [Thermoleophilaceae bacterium]|jgi:hypothetical protein
MDWVDQTLVRLADPATRAALFDQASLAHVVAAAYDVGRMPVEGPYEVAFDELRVGVVADAPTAVHGGWTGPGASERTQAILSVTGLPGSLAPRLDAIWRGSVIARATPPADVIASADTAWAGDATGAPQASTAMTVTFASQPAAPARTELPVVVALLVRDVAASVAELLAQGAILRSRLESLGVGGTVDAALPQRHRLVIAWVVPLAMFDDAGWPGAKSGSTSRTAHSARRDTAARWLAEQGIALIAAPSTRPAGQRG